MAEQATGGGSTRRVEIRRYPNRRYYDTSQSRYLTLQELYDLIRDGAEVRVTDSKSGNDITAKVLAQIIIELDPPKLDVFPVPLLHRLIRANEKIVNDFVDKYFNQALNTFLDSQRKFEQSFRQAVGLEAPPVAAAAVVPEWVRMMWGPLMPPLWPSNGGTPTGGVPAPESAQPLAQGFPSEPAAQPAPSHREPEGATEPLPVRTAPPPPGAADAAGELREVVEDLRRQIAMLREQLPAARPAARPAAAAPAPPPAPAPRRPGKKGRPAR